MLKAPNTLLSSRSKSLLLLALVIIPLCSKLLAGAPKSELNENPADMRAIPVRTIVLSEEKPQLFRSFSGTSRAAQRVSVRPQVSGRLLSKMVNLGDSVNKGDILAHLYNPEATPRAQEAKQRWEQTQVQKAQQLRDFQRIQALYKAGAATKQEFETARTNLWAAETTQAAAKSGYQRAAQVKEEQLIRAPFKGIVTQITLDEGEVISAGQSLMQLADPSQVEVEVTVSEQIASTLNKGDLVPVTFPLLDPSEEIQGLVQEVSPFRERGALPTVVILLPTQSAKPGITVHIHFTIEDNSQFALPISAVIKTGAYGSAVYRVNDNKHVELIPIRPHQIIANQVTISSDLKPRDIIVVAGAQHLFDGAPVTIVNTPHNLEIVGNNVEAGQ